ncbi:DUF4442 domain-containing protein [Psychromicrobium sp. YIM B11713]|uniref:DUF4442 domain-containing protein n=1 Tax=Psychromicrobium sp. YIM B11713 TaxID=3145233 RepID=UPI00374E93D1
MRMLRVKATTVRHALNIWPPLRGAGITVKEISENYDYAKVQLRALPWNRNIVGVHFGGSLFAMTDPFWMLLLMKHLGDEHVVWDKAAEIDFRKPGRGTVTAEFVLDSARLAELRTAASGGEKVLRWFSADVVDSSGEVVATVRKQIYLRKKRG